MNPFNFTSPTKITFGEDLAASGLADALAELGVSKPLIVSDEYMFSSGALKPLLENLADGGIKNSPIFKDVPSDSDVRCVRKGVALAKEHACDSLVAVGGGSVIDTAKVINIGMSLGGDLMEFEGINNLPQALCPLVVIPTTAGTGSEVSAVAMIKNHETSKKLLFGSKFLFANTAILDPKLLLTLPPRLTAATGLDAVTHALEAYVAMGNNCFSDSLALHSLYLLLKYLPIATKSGDDLEARSNTLLASTMAGMAFSNAGVGVVHALAHTVGAKYSVHHGVANAIFLAHGVEFNIEAVSGRYAQVWSYLCNAFSQDPSADAQLSAKFVLGANERECANLLVQAIRDLLNQCELPTRLRDAGVPELEPGELQNLADIAMTDPALMFNPRESSSDDLITILKGAH